MRLSIPLRLHDLCEAIKIFHLGEEENNRTVKDIAETVKKFVPDALIDFKKGQPADRRDYKINCQKLKNVIGWKAAYTVEDGIQEMIDKFQTLQWDWDSPKYRNSSFEYE